MEKEIIETLRDKYAESQEIEERLNLIVQQIGELEEFGDGLEVLEASGKEILASLGKGVYIPAEIKEKELFVGVGAGIFVKKSPVEAVKVIRGQTERLGLMRNELARRNESLDKEMQELMAEIEKGKK